MFLSSLYYVSDRSVKFKKDQNKIFQELLESVKGLLDQCQWLKRTCVFHPVYSKLCILDTCYVLGLPLKVYYSGLILKDNV